jgi:phosphopantothenoylcysteine decarboxylase/phosphopantothenate--cysteine ligase
MADPLAILTAIDAIAALAALDGAENEGAPGDLAGRKVLVSAGPTHEPIDPVRFLGNRSSGKMGFALAEEAVRRGAEVVLVAGPVRLATPAGVERVDVTTALEMNAALRNRAAGADLVVMAAAVGDFRPRHPASRKIKKEAGGLPMLELEENPDIVAGLRDLAPRALLVGFAAETDALDEHARAKLERKRLDLLVANDVSRSDVGFESDENEVTVYRRQGEPVILPKRTKRELATLLFDLFTQTFSQTLQPLAEERTDAPGPL